MTTYAPQAEAVSTCVAPSPPGSSPADSSQPQPIASEAAVAYVPPSAVLSGVHHHNPLQPNRHHPLQDNWHDHHARLKDTFPPPRLPPRSSQPSHGPHHAKFGKSGNPESQAHHHPHADNHTHDRPHIRQRAPESAHSYHHTVNVVAPHHPSSRLTAPTHHTSYLYPVHQLVTPVAHVPIGAAHYAHLPPSIWSPPHAQYHQHPHAQAHQLPPPHHVSPAVMSTPHGHVPYAGSHVHHVASPTHPPTHAYTIPPPHTTTTPHPPPPGPPHAVHPGHHPQQHITYTYTQVQAPPPTHHAVKTAVAVSPSQPVAIGAPVSYTVSAAHPPQTQATTVSPPLPSKTDTLPAHASNAQQSPSLSKGGVPTGEGAKPYEMNDSRPEAVRVANGTVGRTDSSSPRPLKSRPVSPEGAQAYANPQDQRKASNQKEKGQSPSGQPTRKPRKPYTIKKSREVWTPEEHSRFLQALQLYDRDWKKIESYIGTKTVLQIRSHAQKHFGKVTKYKTGEYIPPPRPKKRAALPYPRSRVAGQCKSFSSNGSATDKTAGGENGAHSPRDQTAQERVNGIKFSADAEQGLPARNGTINGITQEGLTTAATDNQLKQPNSKPPHGVTVEAPERRSRSAAYGDRYSSGSYERPNDNRSPEHAQREKLPETNGHTRWHPPPPSEELGRERIPTAPRASSSSTDIKTGISSYASDPHVHHRGNSSYSEDLGRREVQYDRRYRHATSHAVVNSENNSVSQRECRHSPKRLSSSLSMEHDTSTINAVTRKKMAVPNNSLLVLSNCVDLMSRETLPERQPAAGWATAAAARRAHRAKVIRSRKPPLPQPSLPAHVDNPGRGGKGSPQRDVLEADMLGEQSSRHHSVMKSVSPRDGSPSPPVNSPSEYGSHQTPPDPQRSSTGSGTGSDDAIAGFSSSDRPSVSGSAAGSGTGGSLETSDAGEPEEDPKSSIDGSGDDGNRRSPPSRDSSPADPNSSGSRENSPNECPTPQQSIDGDGRNLDSALQKSPERNGMPREMYERVSRGDKGVDYKNLGTENTLTQEDPESRENGRYNGHGQENGKGLSNEDDRKLHILPRTVLSARHDEQISLHSRSPRDDQRAQIHPHAVHNLSPNTKKRLRPNIEHHVHSRTDGQVGADGRDSESKRQRMRHSTREANYSPDQPYHRRDFAERHR